MECIDPILINPKIEKVYSRNKKSHEFSPTNSIGQLTQPHQIKTYIGAFMSFGYLILPKAETRLQPLEKPGKNGMVENGGWQAYWSAQKKPANWSQITDLKVNKDRIKSVFGALPSTEVACKGVNILDNSASGSIGSGCKLLASVKLIK